MDTSQQFLVSAPSDKAKIIIDHREDPVFDELLAGHGVLVERVQLEVGDFICSARCIVERKTRSDFEMSILDGRLFNQLHNMQANYPRVIVLVEGEQTSGNISPEALMGAYTTLVTDFGVSLFFTRNKEKTAELVYSIAKHEQLARKQPMRIYAKRKALTLAQMQRGIIEMFPMVGPKLARALLEHFGNIENIARASERELLEVEGMGKKRAKVIHNVLMARYETSEDEGQMI